MAPRQVFFRSLATMFQAGVPLSRALELLGRQMPGHELTALAVRLESGYTLSHSMARVPLFTLLHCRLVEVGERTGALAAVLEELSRYEEARVRLEMRVRQALYYPAAVVLVCLVVGLVVPPLLFRGLYDLFQERHLALPWPTRCVMALSGALSSPWLYLGLVGLAALGMALWMRFHQHPAVRLHLGRALDLVPGLGKTLRLLGVSRFARGLALTARAGLPLLSCLDLSARLSLDPILLERLPRLLADVTNGLDLERALEATGYFPASFLGTVEVGLASGKLVAVLDSLVRLYEGEVEHAIELLLGLLEPLALGLLGVLVGFVVIATLLPMPMLLEKM